MARSRKIPSYRLHKQSGQAIVTLRDPLTGQRKDVLLGPHGTPQSRSEYARVIQEWEQADRRLLEWEQQSDVTVNEALLQYVRHVESYYRKNNKPTQQQHRIKRALRPVRDLYGHSLLRDFGPKALKAVRETFVRDGLVRRYVNHLVGCVKQWIKRCVAEELAPSSSYHALQTVVGLKKGRCEAKEGKMVHPVAWSTVKRTLPYLNRQVRAMVLLQWWTGARSEEVCMIRPCDIDTRGEVWLYFPQTHKTEHHGHHRIIYLGRRGQSVLRPFLQRKSTAYCFSPKEAMEERAEERRKRRKTKVQPSQRNRRKGNPKKQPRDHYDRCSYHRHIASRCKQHGIEHWHPHQLRHARATEVRKLFGLEASQIALGHASMSITEVYAQKHSELGIAVAKQRG